MSNFILSCSDLIPSISFERLKELTLPAQESTCLIISTQFSLPFTHIDSSKKLDWCLYRLKYFREALWASVCKQSFSFKSTHIIWVIFVSRGDRSRLNLPPVEITPTGICVIWSEVEHFPGKPDDYYRNVVMENICIKIARNMSKIRDINQYLFLRLDSDDFISSNYLAISLLLSRLLRLKRLESTFFYFPCGLVYNKKKLSLSTYIWPESSFCIYFATRARLDRSIWKYSHDKISYFTKNRSVITNKPMWCVTVGHGNMANSDHEYFNSMLPSTANILAML